MKDLNINYSQLRGQKTILLKVIAEKEKEGDKAQLSALSGILHLIDSIQDNAVDKLGKPSLEVFGFES